MKTQTTPRFPTNSHWLFLNLIAALFVLTSPALAQTWRTFTGEVQTEDGKPLPYAEIAILTIQGKLINGTLADSTGTFSLRTQTPDTCILRIAFLGYQTQQDTLILTDKKAYVPLGVIRLPVVAKRLPGIEIVVDVARQWSTLRAGEQEYHPQQDATFSGSTALEILEAIPGIEVDIQGRVLYRGRPVRFYINGKPSALLEGNAESVLQALTASQIERITVISVPGAREEANISSAIINIELKKGVRRTDRISASLTITYPERHSLGIFLHTPWLGGSWSLGITLARNWMPMDVRQTRERLTDSTTRNTTDSSNSTSTSVSALTSITHREFLTHSLFPTLNVEYAWGRWRLHLGGYLQLREQHIQGQTRYESVTPENQFLAQRFAQQYSRQASWQTEGRLQYICPDTQPCAMELYTRWDYVRRQTTETLSESAQDTLWIVPIPYQQLTRIQSSTDLITDLQGYLPLRKDTSLWMQAGIYHRWRNYQLPIHAWSSTDSIHWVRDTLFAFAGQYGYREQVYAFWSEMGGKWRAWQWTLGIRIEGNQLNITTPQSPVQWHALSIFPSLRIERRFSQRVQMGLVYARKTQRPSFHMLAPFWSFSDRFFQWMGNPALRPAWIHLVELHFHWRASPTLIFSIVPYLRYEEAPIERIRLWDTTLNMIVARPENLRWLAIGGADLSVYWRPTRWWKSTIQLTGRYGFLDGTNILPDLQERQWGGRLFLNQEFRLSRQISAQLHIRTMLPSFHGNHQHTNWATMIRIGMQGKFWQRRLTVTLQAINPFNTMFFQVEVEEPDFTVHTYFSRWVPRYALTVSYNFRRHHQKRLTPSDDTIPM